MTAVLRSLHLTFCSHAYMAAALLFLTVAPSLAFLVLLGPFTDPGTRAPSPILLAWILVSVHPVFSRGSGSNIFRTQLPQVTRLFMTIPDPVPTLIGK